MMNFDAVESFIGSRWVYKRNDCWAVAKKASLKIFNKKLPLIPLPDNSNLGDNIDIFYSELNNSKWVKIETPKSGCMALFYAKINGVLSPVHVGIYIVDGNILHCDGSVRKGGCTTYDQVKTLVGKYNKYECVTFHEYSDNDNT